MKPTKDDYEKLCDEIWHHNRLYFQEMKPVISDEEFDALLRQLEKIEAEHPEWISDTSPTQRLGEKPLEGFKEVTHLKPMLSLEKAFSKDEIAAFNTRTLKLLETSCIDYLVELKLDGLAISVTYENGKLKSAVTRGDGKTGSDVTQNLKTFESLPLRIAQDQVPHIFEVRGEVFLPIHAFERMNQERKDQDLPLWANPRNAAAGSLKLLDPKEVAKRPDLQVVFYGTVGNDPRLPKLQHELYPFFERLGLPTVHSYLKRYAKLHHKPSVANLFSSKLAHSIDDIMTIASQVANERNLLPFAIDGLVIKIDNLPAADSIGSTGKHPRGAIAYKFSAEAAETKLLSITCQVGRTGVITPVAELEPTFLAGSTISRATLHNFDELERKDIRPGDTVIIEKGGDVIPKVVEVVLSKRPPDTHRFHIPKTCPSCHTPLVKDPNEVAWRCPNTQNCFEQVVRRLTHFAGKDGLDIEHLGEKVVEQLVRLNLATNPADLFRLTKTQLLTLEGFKDKSAENILKSLNHAKTVPLDRFIMALGIRFVGSGTSELIASHAKTLENLLHITKDELLSIHGIGDKAASETIQFFHNPTNQKLIHDLISLGLHIKAEAVNANPNHPLYNKNVVITGTLSSLTRQQAQDLLKQRGAKSTDSVSKNTNYLICGSDPGSKLAKAQKLGVTVLNEEEFLKLAELENRGGDA